MSVAPETSLFEDFKDIAQEMTPKVRISRRVLFFLCLLVAVNFAIWFALANRYEFHPGQSGAVMWRCNRLSGAVYCTQYGGQWNRILDVDFVPTWPKTK